VLAFSTVPWEIHSNLLSRYLLLALVLISVAASAIRMLRVLRIIRSARPDEGRRTASPAQTLWKFFWDVLCQAKVIRGRPVAGLAHAFVFWGFCVFVPVSVNHVLQGFGIDLLRHESRYGAFYYWFAFLFGAFGAVGILVLAVRRFVVRPQWLKPAAAASARLWISNVSWICR